MDRTVRDLQGQLLRREKLAQQLTDDVAKGRDKIERLLQMVDELQAEEARSQLVARRAERDLREEKEKALRLERELEGWKGLRMERGGKAGGGGGWGGNNGGEWGGSTRGLANGNGNGIRNRSGSGIADGVEVGENRRMSDSKGFL